MGQVQIHNFHGGERMKRKTMLALMAAGAFALAGITAQPMAAQ